MSIYKHLLFSTILATGSSLVLADSNIKSDYQSFIPKNWKVLEKAQGDLNHDHIADLALIIEDTDPKNIVSNDNLGSSKLNINQRKLLILFKNSQGYQLIATNTSLPSEGDIESPCLADPLGENDPLEIKNGLLKVNLHYWLSCSSWYVTNHSYTFRYQNQAFKLIGYDSDDFHRASGAITEQSINFLTGKVKNTSGGNEFAEGNQPIDVKWSKLKKTYSLRLEQVKFNEYSEFK